MYTPSTPLDDESDNSGPLMTSEDDQDYNIAATPPFKGATDIPEFVLGEDYQFSDEVPPFCNLDAKTHV
jgi:hypothetical protein